MIRHLTESDKRLLKIYRGEWEDSKEQERKNSSEMPRLSGYIEAMEFCISHIIAEKKDVNVATGEGVNNG